MTQAVEQVLIQALFDDIGAAASEDDDLAEAAGVETPEETDNEE